MSLSEYDLQQKRSVLNKFLTDNPSLWGCTLARSEGAKRWKVQRDNDTPWPKEYVDTKGSAIWYTEEGALKKAEELNALEITKTNNAPRAHHYSSMLTLAEEIEKKTSRILYRIGNDNQVDPELSNDLRAAVDAFLAKADERISNGKN